jgi:hypothetical protein
MAKNLWKPSAEGKNAGKLVLLANENLGSKVYIVDAKTGQVLDTGAFDKRYDGDGRYIYRFNKPGASFTNVVLINDQGKAAFIADGGAGRLQWDSFSQAKKGDISSYPKTAPEGMTITPTSNSGGNNYLPGQGNVAGVQLLDPSALSFNRTEIEFTDPIETLRAIAAENKGQISENYLLSLQQAGQLSEANTKQLLDYLNVMSPLQLQMVGIENQFNQQQKLQAAETAMPGIQDTLNKQIKDAETLASGRLLTSVEDRALEEIARSAGADAAWTRGLGDDSLAGKRLSDQLSVGQRMQLMQQGENYMNTAVQLAAQTLMDSPNKANLSQQISGTPQRTLSDIAQQQQAIWNQGTTLSPEAAQSSIVQQRIQQAQLDADLQKDYNNYMMQIMSANTQAINTQAQDIVNDQANTAAAQAKQQASNLAALALNKGKIDQKTYDLIRSVIEQTGTVNMSDYVKDWDKWYANYLNNQSGNSGSSSNSSNSGSSSNSSNSGNSTNSNNSSGNSGSNNSNNSSGVNKSLTESTQPKPSTTTYLLKSSMPSYSSNTHSGYGVNSDGSINLPQRNPYFNENASYWEQFNSEINDVDLTGVF